VSRWVDRKGLITYTSTFTCQPTQNLSPLSIGKGGHGGPSPTMAFEQQKREWSHGRKLVEHVTSDLADDALIWPSWGVRPETGLARKGVQLDEFQQHRVCFWLHLNALGHKKWLWEMIPARPFKNSERRRWTICIRVCESLSWQNRINYLRLYVRMSTNPKSESSQHR